MDFIGDFMQTTKKELKSQSANYKDEQDAQIHSLDSGKKSGQAIQSESTQLSKNLAISLMGLIKDVNASGVTPETVNASCNAAAQIYKILRLNFEMKKEGF
jgi:hypothetical protein